MRLYTRLESCSSVVLWSGSFVDELFIKTDLHHRA